MGGGWGCDNIENKTLTLGAYRIEAKSATLGFDGVEDTIWSKKPPYHCQVYSPMF